MLYNNSMRATLSSIRSTAYRKPQNVHLNKYAVAVQRRGHAFCPFYGDKAKGCRCHEPLNPLSRDIIKAFIHAQERHYRLKNIVITLRTFYKANKRNSRLSPYGEDWQGAKEYVKSHRLEKYDITLSRSYLTRFNLIG